MRMVKRALLFGAAVLSCALLSACGAKAPEPVACAQVLAAVEGEQPFNELVALDSRLTEKYLDIDLTLTTDAAMSLDASRVTAEQIVVLTARDEASLEALVEALEAHRAATLAQYRDYQPAETPKLENAVLQTRGLQAAFIVSADHELAAQSLKTAWGQ